MNKPALQFDFIVEKDTHTLIIRREFAGKRQLVWDCHTKRELLDRWFAPKPLITKTKSMEFRDGGHWLFAMIDPEGTEYWTRMDYLKINAIDGYTALDAFSNAKGEINPNLPRSQWEATFSDLPNGHTMVVTVVVYPSAEALQTVLEMGMEEGMKSTLDRLDELLPELV